MTEQDNNATMTVRGLTLLLKQHDPTEAWEWQSCQCEQCGVGTLQELLNEQHDI
jgi:hypothetical protein